VWWWILIWFLLAVGAIVVLGLLAWRLVRQGIALFAQLGRSASVIGDALAPPHATYAPAPSALVDPPR
jgi:hypothetical protein